MERLFILSNAKMREFDSYSFFDAWAIYKGGFYLVLFATKGTRHYIYLVKELKYHYTYRSVFGSKRHGTATSGYEVFAKKEVSKEEGNRFYLELKKNIFRAKSNKDFVKINTF